ncbi:MAG: orotate phosphoribosyltransferase [Bacteroidales bacterium]|nr:orotate phosphoribosyltransferase [Bacteroidales bacterium]
MSSHERLKELFLARAVQFGDFTLASGKKSQYYINSKKVLFHSETITLLGELLAEVTQDLEFQAIGGLEVGAIPMAAAALTAFHRSGKPMEGFFVRKNVKSHGSQELVEGQVRSGDRVVIIDDVLTTGGSALQAVRAVENIGATVVRIVCICDRLQGAAETLKGYDFRPLFTVRDIGINPDGT